MKRYKVVGFEDAYPVFWFTVTAGNFSEALRTISKDYYMNGVTFTHFEIMEI